MATRFSAAHYRAKATIAACAKAGAGIEYLPDAPCFRYYPPEQVELHCGAPSKRGAVSFPAKMKLHNWKPPSIDLNPMYTCPMAGDSEELTRARKAWHEGDPGPLREWLAKQGKAKNVTAAEFKSIRLRAGLTQSQLAQRLRISDKRTIRYWETGERTISGPVSLLMEQLDRGELH